MIASGGVPMTPDAGDEALRHDTPRIGPWLDTSEEILARSAEARV